MHRTRETERPAFCWLMLMRAWRLVRACCGLIALAVRAIGRLWRLSIDTGMLCCRMLFLLALGLFGLIVLANLLFAMVTVLAYPWLH